MKSDGDERSGRSEPGPQNGTPPSLPERADDLASLPKWPSGLITTLIGLGVFGLAVAFFTQRGERAPLETHLSPSADVHSRAADAQLQNLLGFAQLKAAPPICQSTQRAALPALVHEAEQLARGADRSRFLRFAQRAQAFPELALWAAERLRQLQALEPAHVIAQNVLGQCPQYVQAQATLADVDYEQGNFNEATSGFEAVLAVDPAFDAARFKLGLCFVQQGDPQRAAATFDELEARAPDYPRLHSARAQAYFLAGDLKRAARDAQVARKRDRGDERARQLLELIQSRRAP